MTNCRIDQLGDMDASEERKFWILVERELRCDDGAAAKSHLATGLPIYYCHDDFSDDIVREWPDGRKELVQVSDAGDIMYVRSWHQADADWKT
jgi:hypothetical protein